MSTVRTSSPRRSRRRRTTAVLVLCGVQVVDVLGVTSALTAIPVMLEDLAAPAAATGVLATAYAMFFGGLLILGARLGDRYGARRVLVAGIALFVVAAVVGATAGEIGQLLAARALQGAAAGISVPCALRLLLDAAPDGPPRRTALALWSAGGAVAGVLGYAVGGGLTAWYGWRAIFWLNVPIGVLLAVGVLRRAPARAVADRPGRLDLAGVGLLVTSVMAVIVGAALVEQPATRTLGVLLVVAGALVAAGFAVQQRRARDPLVPRAAVGDANVRTGTLTSFVNTATTSSAGVVAMLVLQQQLGASPVQAALALMPFSVAVVAGSLLSRPLGGRLRSRRLAALGLALIGAGNAVLTLTYGRSVGVVAGVTVAGLGLGLASVAATSIGTGVPPELEGTASGVLNTGAQLGTAVGVAGLVTVAGVVHVVPGPAAAWAVAGVAALVSAALLVRRGPGRQT